MVTYKIENRPAASAAAGTRKAYIEGSCLSTDAKTTDVTNGSILLEMDTGKVYMYDETGNTWREF